MVQANGQDEAAKKAELRVLKKVKKNDLTIATFHQKRIPNVNKIRGFGEVDVDSVTVDIIGNQVDAPDHATGGVNLDTVTALVVARNQV